jgi:hypothetical protein
MCAISAVDALEHDSDADPRWIPPERRDALHKDMRDKNAPAAELFEDGFAPSEQGTYGKENTSH